MRIRKSISELPNFGFFIIQRQKEGIGLYLCTEIIEHLKSLRYQIFFPNFIMLMLVTA